jgi:hypothetical protein
LREASLRLRFLRQEVEIESEKHKKPQIPENEKQIDKTNEKRKANKMPL